MSSKEIESMLLSERDDIQDKLSKLLEENLEDVLKIIFDVFHNKVISGPLEEAEIILNEIELYATNSKSEYYKIWLSFLRNEVYRFSSLSVNDNLKLKNMKFKLLDIIRKINERKKKKDNKSLYDMYYSLVFKGKDINTVALILLEEKNILGKKDTKGHDLFYNILDYYRRLDENSEELDYYLDVIKLFVKYYEKSIISNLDVYLALLNEEGYLPKKHVTGVRNILSNKSDISIAQLKEKYGVEAKGEKDILEEILSFKVDYSSRTFIDAPFVTIDGAEALCLDDAIAILKNDDGSYFYYVAITDIPSLVMYASLTYNEALRKGETLFLCDDTIDLYPKILANDLCSLVEGKIRPAIVYKFLVDADFNVDTENMEIIKGTIRVHKRLSYDDVNKGTNLTEKEYQDLEKMFYIAVKLRNSNNYRDDYRTLENLIRADATYHHSLFSGKSISANIVEQSMLLVGSGASNYFKERGLVYLFRNLKMTGEVGIKAEIDKLFKINKDLIGEKEYLRIISEVKRAYLSAYYSPVNEGHEGLGYSSYSHSTSSARRFCDSFNQYLTYFQVFNNVSDMDYYELERTAKEVAMYLNARKREIDKFASEYNFLKMSGNVLERKK